MLSLFSREKRDKIKKCKSQKYFYFGAVHPGQNQKTLQSPPASGTILSSLGLFMLQLAIIILSKMKT